MLRNIVFLIIAIIIGYSISLVVKEELYCHQFSGTASYGWGKGKTVECVANGCHVVKTLEIGTGDSVYDNEGYNYLCIP